MSPGNRSRFVTRCAWCSLVIWGSVAAVAWTVAENNPREGWSMAAVWTGLAPMPGSGERAYLEAGYAGRPITVNLAAHGLQPDARVEVIVLRTRAGLFVPWIETTELRLLSYSGGPQHLRTGTTDPAWPGVLASVRPAYAWQNNAWHNTVLAGIDRELAGQHPRRRYSAGPAGLDALFVLAHGAGLVGLWCAVRRCWRAGTAHRHRAEGHCSACGYDLRGGGSRCPECGAFRDTEASRGTPVHG